MIDVLASEPQFIEHTLPVYRALPSSSRGTFYVANHSMLAYLATLGTSGKLWERSAADADVPVVVASAGDCNRTRRAGRLHVAYMEHGIGQSYGGDRRTAKHPSYAGGDGRDHVSLILAPNDYAAKRWRERYPTTPVHVIGSTRALPPPSDEARELVISFHWSGPIPEMRNALSHYKRGLPELAKRVPLIGHGHPRFGPSLAAVYRRYRIEYVPSLEDVARRARVYAVDNSSTLWELGRTRPVIALDAPWYRPFVHHGLRFWDAVPGPRVAEPDELVDVAVRLLAGETTDERLEREAVVERVIPHLDGAKRAARLLTAWNRGRTDANAGESR